MQESSRKSHRQPNEPEVGLDARAPPDLVRSGRGPIHVRQEWLLDRVRHVPRAYELVASEPPARSRARRASRVDLAVLKALGIDLDAVTEQLQVEGVDKFAKSFREMLATVGEKVGRVAGRV